MRLLSLSVIFLSLFARAQHPIAFESRADLDFVKSRLVKNALLKDAFNDIKKSVDKYLGKDVDVPYPKDPAGGYTHERHKENYMLLFNAGLLYNLTGEKKYALLAKNIFLKYARLNPSLKNHPQATSSSPGHLFWQALNDANWLVYSGLGYDLIYNSLSASERKTIEDGAFKPEVDFITKDLASWFNLIHNHGVWACAGVGIVGIATNNKDYINAALYGTRGDGKSGFIAQLDKLFSPDGYYTEGPYYVRYALLPFYLFANALNNARPELKIFAHRDSILKKGLVGALQQTNLNGAFFPLNDALKDKDYKTNEMVMAICIAWNIYGKENSFLTVARNQGRVVLNRGGASIASQLAMKRNISPYYPYVSVEFTDGAEGNEGGLSYLRVGKDADLSTLCFKYASHGLSHGHFDELNFLLYDKGNEIFTDYGSARFVNVEQKYGGRYLRENAGYAVQTIAHNTIVVDEASQFNAREGEAEKYHSNKIFSSIGNPAVQVVSAKEEHAYKSTKLFRTVFFLELPGNKKKIIVDLNNVASPDIHQYDLPFHYSGQIINTSFKYHPFTAVQEAVGRKNGYQYLWKEAEASLEDTVAQFTFLNGETYYTISSLIDDSAKIFFARSGANDPDFNLRREPAFIIRKKGRSQSFINVIEIHGNYDPVAELSSNSYPAVKSIELLQKDERSMIVRIKLEENELLIATCVQDPDLGTKHSYHGNNTSFEWTGPYVVLYNGKVLK